MIVTQTLPRKEDIPATQVGSQEAQKLDWTTAANPVSQEQVLYGICGGLVAAGVVLICVAGSPLIGVAAAAAAVVIVVGAGVNGGPGSGNEL